MYQDWKNHPHQILEVCFSNSLGGLELYMENLSRHLQERNHDVTAVVPEKSILLQKLKSRNIKYFTLTPRIKYLDILIAYRLAKIIQNRSIEIIHAHQSGDLSTLILAKKIAGKGKIIFTQQMESSRRKKDLFHKWIYQNIDFLLPITDRIQNQVLQNTTIEPKKVQRLYYGIDLKKFKPDAVEREAARKEFNFGPADVIIGVVGRLEKGKGQHLVLQAFKELSGEYKNTKLLFVGAETVGQNGYLAELKKLVKDFQLEHRVIFTGFREDVSAVSQALDIIVLSSKKETFGLSLIEGMAQQKAPIGTNAGGVPEIIEHGVNGLLFEPLNFADLQAKLEILLKDAELREKIARKALITVQEKFNLKDHLTALEQILNKAASSL